MSYESYPIVGFVFNTNHINARVSACMSAPFPRQFDLHVGKGEWGPTLTHTTPTPIVGNLTDTLTNMSYQRSPYLGVGLIFSRGAFMTQVSQTGPSEKTLWAVPLYAYKGVQHAAGDSYDDIFRRLAALPWSPPGLQFRLRWSSTYTLTYDDPNVTGDLLHVRADLHVEQGQDPEAPDSPPPFWPHKGHPVNFHGTSTRLAAMADLLRCSTVL